MSELTVISKEENTEINTVLLFIIKLIGVPPEKLMKEDLTIIISFLKHNYQQLPLEDLKRAFELGVKGELDFDLNHYNRFNSLYVSNVLLSFRRWRNKNKQIKKKEEFKALPYSTNLGEDAYLFIKKVFEEKGKEPLIANWNHAFEYMEEKQIIIIDKNEYQTHIYSVISGIKDEIDELVKQRRNPNTLRNYLKNKMLLKSECRKQYIIKHFKN